MVGASDARGAGGSWLSVNRPVLMFVLVFGVLVIAFNAYYSLSFRKTAVFESYLEFNAGVCASILRGLGEEAGSSGTLVYSPRFSMTFATGCDCLQAAAFFVFAVFASPVRVRFFPRLWAVLAGTAFILVLNMGRVITLYYAGIHSPKLFNVMHLEVWQVQMIFLPIILWLGWLWWAKRRRTTTTATAHVAA